MVTLQFHIHCNVDFSFADTARVTSIHTNKNNNECQEWDVYVSMCHAQRNKHHWWVHDGHGPPQGTCMFTLRVLPSQSHRKRIVLVFIWLHCFRLYLESVFTLVMVLTLQFHIYNVMRISHLLILQELLPSIQTKTITNVRSGMYMLACVMHNGTNIIDEYTTDMDHLMVCFHCKRLLPKFYFKQETQLLCHVCFFPACSVSVNSVHTTWWQWHKAWQTRMLTQENHNSTYVVLYFHKNNMCHTCVHIICACLLRSDKSCKSTCSDIILYWNHFHSASIF